MTTAQIYAIVDALCIVESGNNPDAPDGDGGKAVGVLQIWPIMVAECNRIMAYRVWNLDDRRTVDASRDMCACFLSYWTLRRKIIDPIKAACLWHYPDGRDDPQYAAKVREAMKGLDA